MADIILVLLIAMTIAALNLGVLIWLAMREIAAYRPIVRAYLEAQAQAQGVRMDVPADASEPPGRLYAPLTDTELHPDDEDF